MLQTLPPTNTVRANFVGTTFLAIYGKLLCGLRISHVYLEAVVRVDFSTDPFQRPDLAPQLWAAATCSDGRCLCSGPRACLPAAQVSLGRGVTALSDGFCTPYVNYPTCVVVDRAADTVRCDPLPAAVRPHRAVDVLLE